MLPSSGGDLSIPHDSDPAGDNILATVGGHLNVHSSSIAFVLWWHLGVCVAISDAADFGLAEVYGPVELVDLVACFCKLLVGDGGAAAYCRDEAICNGTRCVGEVVVLHMEDGFS